MGPCNEVNISVLQNSVPYINHTVLQSIDRQRVAETRLFHAISYHLQSICADYQLFATCGGHQFFPPSVVSLDQTAYMLVAGFATEWHNWQVGLCNALKINML